MPRKANTQSLKRSAPEHTFVTSSLFGEGRRLKPFGGDTAKLVLSIDIGTTFSAASFCILRPRAAPNLEIVSSWPEQTTPDTKVSTVIYYDQSGFPVGCGAETTNEDFKARAFEENWCRVEWFKLALGPSHLVTTPGAITSSTGKSKRPPQSIPKTSNTHRQAAIASWQSLTLNPAYLLATGSSYENASATAIYYPISSASRLPSRSPLQSIPRTITSLPPTTDVQRVYTDSASYYPISSASRLPSRSPLQSIPRTGIPSLPPAIDVHRVYADFMRFMFGHIKYHIGKHYSSGTEILSELLPTMEVVFTIPNGWEMRQRHDMRIAAVQAGLMGSVMDGQNEEEKRKKMNEAEKRISFVSEAEAAMVFAADSGHVDSWLKAGEDIILCDAGGGTIDTTVYKIIKERPLELKEKYASKCVMAGAILVNQAAERYITDKVKGTTWDTPQKIQQLMDEFERDTKKRFVPSSGDYGIGQSGTSEFIPEANVRNGRLYIPARDFETFFEPTLTAIKAGIEEIYVKSRKTTKNVIMVGGLMNSSYAYEHLESWGLAKGLSFSKPDGAMAQAVSHGGLMWYLTKPVKAYITKFHYGSDVARPVDRLDAIRHPDRKIVSRADGVKIIEGWWDSIARMGEELNPDIAVFRHYQRFFDEDDIIENLEFEEKIFIHREKEVPKFVTTINGELYPNTEHLCSVLVNLRVLFNLTPWKISKENGKKFKILKFDISIVNEGYDLKAFASWNIMGKEHKGQATVVVPDVTR